MPLRCVRCLIIPIPNVKPYLACCVLFGEHGSLTDRNKGQEPPTAQAPPDPSTLAAPGKHEVATPNQEDAIVPLSTAVEAVHPALSEPAADTPPVLPVPPTEDDVSHVSPSPAVPTAPPASTTVASPSADPIAEVTGTETPESEAGLGTRDEPEFAPADAAADAPSDHQDSHEASAPP